MELSGIVAAATSTLVEVETSSCAGDAVSLTLVASNTPLVDVSTLSRFGVTVSNVVGPDVILTSSLLLIVFSIDSEESMGFHEAAAVETRSSTMLAIITSLFAVVDEFSLSRTFSTAEVSSKAEFGEGFASSAADLSVVNNDGTEVITGGKELIAGRDEVMSPRPDSFDNTGRAPVGASSSSAELRIFIARRNEGD